MAHRRRALVAAFLAVAALTAAGAAPASASHPAARGAATHPLWSSSTAADSARELDLLVKAHATTVRIDLGWSTLEADGPGKRSSWYVEKADAFFAQARARGLKVLVTFWTTPCWASSAPSDKKQDCTGAWWDRGVDRYPPSNPADYGRAAAWVIDRWGDDIAALEVWNEPNYDAFFQSSDYVGDYAALLKAAYPAVKAVDPGATVLGPAMLMSDVGFLEALYAKGIKGSFDALSVHPFNFGRPPGDTTAPNGAKYSYALGVPWVHETMEKYGDGDKDIWFTEFGWSSCTIPPGSSTWCIGPETQAQYIGDAIRMIHDRWPYVGGAFVYNLRNKGTDLAGRESQMGLVHQDFTPKPSYGAFSTAMDELSRPDPLPPPQSPATPADKDADSPAATPQGLLADPVPDPPTPAPPPPDLTPPTVSGLKAVPRRFSARRAAAFSFGLSEPAKVVLTFTRSAPGRRAGRACVAPSRAPRRARPCRRRVAAGRPITTSAGTGTIRVRIGPRKLRPGSYRVQAVATDGEGNESRAATASFAVVSGT